jgi:hypothetical protein
LLALLRLEMDTLCATELAVPVCLLALLRLADALLAWLARSPGRQVDGIFRQSIFGWWFKQQQ